MAANRNLLQTALHKPYDRLLFAKEVLSSVFQSGLKLSASPVPASPQPNKSEQVVINNIAIYGTVTLDDSTEIICYEITLQPNVCIEQSKVAIQRYVRKLLVAGQAALVNFIAPQNKNVWRLTLVAKDSELTNEGVKEKITHAKRYTYLLGPSETCKTAAERFEALSIEKEINFQALVNAFSIEKLSKVFFDEYTLHYQKFCDYLQESSFRKSVFNISIPTKAIQEEKDKLCKPIRDFVKKHLGRIVFLYFVQKKGWLGASNTDYKDGLTDFIKKLFAQSGGNDSFYPSWLTVLFFDTLNKERANDDFKMPDGKKVKVPFLNGGLFDKEEYDEAVLTIPAKLFHNPEFEDTILTEKNRNSARGFLDFLDAFNFTVHEDSPDDHTVAVDPEMLGHIFENLLEDNKDKGAFYTPKEIVHYMCQESLAEYLTTQLKITDEKLKTDVAYLVKRKEVSDAVKPLLSEIDRKLDIVKICDPAIGSGAFPMGLLQEIHTTKEVIAFELQQPWKPADVKENIIQNSIYGVDIEKGAVDIARLRFWLSLIVDEEKPRALPNLDYKIVVGDSLVSKFEGEIIEIDWDKKGSVGKADTFVKNVQQLLKDIAEKQKQFFKPDNKNKKKSHAQIRDLKLELLINQLSYNKAAYENRTPVLGGFAPNAKETKHNIERELTVKGFDKNITKLQNLKKNNEETFEHFDWKLDFPEVLNPLLKENGGLNATGFDIVIGNPPYVDIKGLPAKDVELFFKKFETAQNRINLYSIFIEKAITLLNQTGSLIFITPNSMLMNSSYEKLRRMIGERVNQIIKLPDAIFENAIVETIIFQTLNAKSQPDVRGKVYPNNVKTDLRNVDFKTFSVANWQKDTEFRFNVFQDVNYEPVLEKIEKYELRFFNVADFSLGITPYDKYKGHTVSTIKNRAFHSATKIDKTYKPLISGSRIKKFYIEENIDEYIKYGDWLGAPREERFFTEPRLVVRQILSSNPLEIYCGYTESKLYFTQIGFSIISKKEYPQYSNLVLLTLINSKLINFYHNNRFLDTEKNVFQKILIANCKNFPLPKISQNDKTLIENTVKDILKLRVSRKDTSDLERELDIRLYHLYNLSFEEAKLIDDTLTDKEFQKLK